MSVKYIVHLLIILLTALSANLWAQVNNDNIITKIELLSGSSTPIVYPDQTIQLKNGKFLPVPIVDVLQPVQLRIFLNDQEEWASIQLAESDAYQIISQPIKADSFYLGMILISDPVTYPFPVVRMKCLVGDSISFEKELPLFTHILTQINYEREMLDLYQEEEKTIELFVPFPYNIKVDGLWQASKDFDFRINYGLNSLILQIRGHTLGAKVLKLNLKTIAPILLAKQTLSYDLPPVEISFNVKPNRLEFLNVDKNSIYFNQDYKYSEEILFDNNRNLAIEKTYRIEDRQEGGGNLVAEFYTVSPVSNGKILCKLRTFSLHRMQDGYLYIKENDKTRFITNFNIIEKPRIDRVSIMPQGGNWTSNLTVYPGQQVEVKIEGKGFNESTVNFDGIPVFKYDSLKSTEEVSFYTFQVPFTINKKSIELFLNRKPSGHSLSVREYQQPSDFDFVRVNFGEGYKTLNSEFFDKPIFYEEAIREISLIFDRNKVDKPDRLYGKQYLQIEVRILNSRNVLLDIQNINQIVVCPSESSTRGIFYNSSDCRSSTVLLNEYLRQKTFDLEPFSQIIITIKHDPTKYSDSRGFEQKINLVLKRKLNFDVQFSFPAGLFLMQFSGQGEQVNRLTGVSTSVLAQLNFYDPNRIGRLKPYSVGIGFLGLNAFNFGNEDNRDLGIVILGTITPIRRDARFFVPLYFGGGYLIEAGTFFLVFGPGVQFRF